LDAVNTLSVPSKAKLTGKLRTPLSLKWVEGEPAFVILQGPESILAKIREVFTDPIDLSLIPEDRRIPIGLDIDSPQVHLATGQPSQVAVDIKLEQIP